MPVVACQPENGGLRPWGKNAVYIIIPDFYLKSKSFSRFFQKIRRERPPGNALSDRSDGAVRRRMGRGVPANADALVGRRSATDRLLRMSTDEYGWLRRKRVWNRQTGACGIGTHIKTRAPTTQSPYLSVPIRFHPFCPAVLLSVARVRASEPANSRLQTRAHHTSARILPSAYRKRLDKAPDTVYIKRIVVPEWRNGRRARLKIWFPLGVWVQVPSPVPKSFVTSIL